MYSCDICNKSYTQKHSLNEHNYLKHGIQTRGIGFRIKCPECDFSCAYYYRYRNHLASSHNVDIKIHEEQFSSFSEFTAWKCDIERESRAMFYLASGMKKLANGRKKFFYRCSRQGHYVDNVGDARKRRMKSSGTYKTGKFCPAYIEVIHDRDTDSVHATYCLNHFGHECSLDKMVLNPKERVKLAEMISSGISLSKILQEVRRSARGKNLDRIHLLTRKDLKNIEYRFGLTAAKDEQRGGINEQVLQEVRQNDQQCFEIQGSDMYFEEDVINKSDNPAASFVYALNGVLMCNPVTQEETVIASRRVLSREEKLQLLLDWSSNQTLGRETEEKLDKLIDESIKLLMFSQKEEREGKIKVEEAIEIDSEGRIIVPCDASTPEVIVTEEDSVEVSIISSFSDDHNYCSYG